MPEEAFESNLQRLRQCHRFIIQHVTSFPLNPGDSGAVERDAECRHASGKIILRNRRLVNQPERLFESPTANGYTGDVFSSESDLAPLRVFLWRQIVHAGAAFCLAAVALGIGVAGYHWIAGFGWTDSLLNASMILSGEGPVDRLSTRGAKIFASAYALFGGLVFMITMGLVLTPLVHRLLHRLHIEEHRRKSASKDRVE